jgi:hypothetical protein
MNAFSWLLKLNFIKEFARKKVNPHCAERPNLALKKNIFVKFQTILG